MSFLILVFAILLAVVGARSVVEGCYDNAPRRLFFYGCLFLAGSVAFFYLAFTI